MLDLGQLFVHVTLGEVLGELLLKVVHSLLGQLRAKGALSTCVVGDG